MNHQAREFQGQFRDFLDANPHRLHFCAHGHHPWPDITRDAQRAAWETNARLADRSWEAFREVQGKVRQHLARLFGLPQSCAEEFVFGTNTHELVTRIVSALDGWTMRPLQVLTTDEEFDSFSRQIRRWQESGLVAISTVATGRHETDPDFLNFPAELLQKIGGRQRWDLIYLSPVLFRTGRVLPEFASILQALSTSNIPTILDLYHAAGAVPINFCSQIPDMDQVILLGGGYKYLQAGGGIGFARISRHFQFQRPLNTGWFASPPDSARPENRVTYHDGADAFLGGTFDLVPFFRMNAVFELWESLGWTVGDMWHFCHQLQCHFVRALQQSGEQGRALLACLTWNPGGDDRSHSELQVLEQPSSRMLSFALAEAETIAGELRKQNIDVNFRDGFLRIGFGIYQTPKDADSLATALTSLLTNSKLMK